MGHHHHPSVRDGSTLIVMRENRTVGDSDWAKYSVIDPNCNSYTYLVTEGYCSSTMTMAGRPGLHRCWRRPVRDGVICVGLAALAVAAQCRRRTMLALAVAGLRGRVREQRPRVAGE